MLHGEFEDTRPCCTWQVGDSMTIADSQLATTLAGPLMHLIGRKQQEQLPSVIRWFTTCTRHPALAPFVGMPTHKTC